MFARRLRDSVRRLKDFPLSGRIAPDLDSETVREVLFHDYRILYEVIEGHVWVLGVTHGSRDLRRLAKRRRWS